MKYQVYFSLYGKKMQATVYAVDIETAKRKIMSKIIFHKIEKKDDENLDFFKYFSGFNR